MNLVSGVCSQVQKLPSRKLAVGVAAVMCAATLMVGCTKDRKIDSSPEHVQNAIENFDEAYENLEACKAPFGQCVVPGIDSLQAKILRSKSAMLEYDKFVVSSKTIDLLRDNLNNAYKQVYSGSKLEKFKYALEGKRIQSSIEKLEQKEKDLDNQIVELKARADSLEQHWQNL